MTVLERKQRVVIIGGGITGLAAAYYLQKQVKENKQSIEIQLIEASHRLGGKIQTVKKDGYVIERGPDSFLTRKISATKLVEEVGLKEELISNPIGKSYVVINGEMHPMPGGAVMGIPTQVGPFISTGLFSLTGKMRAAADFVIPRSGLDGDQSLGGFFRRRLGDEVVENLIEPLLSGMYAGNIDRLSLMSTFPQFYEAEKNHRSLIIGMKKTSDQDRKIQTGTGEKKGAFLTLKSGLQSLVNTIEDLLDEVTVRKGIKVTAIEQTSDSYLLKCNNEEVIEADNVIVTTPHSVLSSMFSKYAFFNHLQEMPSTSVATVAMGFPADAIKKDMEGTGFVVSRNSDFSINACTWTHQKWPHTTPEGNVLLRCYVGRAGDEMIVDLSDAQIEKIVLEDLNKIMGISTNPDFTIVTRWKEAMPQYTVGHKERLEKLNRELAEKLPGVFVAGSSFEGLGIPDCIEQAEKAVERVLNKVSSSME